MMPPGPYIVRTSCFTTLLLFFLAVQAQVPVQDSLALVDLFVQTNGNNWHQNDSWLGSESVDMWYGVQVQNGEIKKIDLAGNNLSGNIPANFNLTSQIEHLDLSQNNLSGVIPSSLSSLTSLEYLTLHDNQLSGSLDTWLPHLINLKHVDLSDNQVGGSLPGTLSNLIALNHLDFKNNQIAGTIVPSMFSGGLSLEYLDLSHNNIGGAIPATLNSQTALLHLNLSNNAFLGWLPASLSSLTALKYMNVSYNQLSGSVPASVGDMSNIEFLLLHHNQLSGALPVGMSSLSELKVLEIQFNEFEFVPDLTSNSNLAVLNVSENKLTFDDIIPNIGISGLSYFYAPQDSFGMDSDHQAEVGQPITLSVAINDNANQYFWLKDNQIVASTNVPSMTIAQASFSDAGNYICKAINGSAPGLHLFSRPQVVNVSLSDTVWPGDANGDQHVNHWDILPIGIAYSETGPLRINASTGWTGQYATDWADTLNGGLNYKHIDCNGNGHIGMSDVHVVDANYGSVHLKSDGVSSNGGPMLYLDLLQDTLSAGDTAIALIMLGEDTSLATDIYGLAFSIEYDANLVDSASFNIQFDNSWLGVEGVDMLTYQRNAYQHGRMDVAMTRTDQQSRTSYGQLGIAWFIMIDDLSVKDDELEGTVFEQFNLNLSQIQIVDENYQSLSVGVGNDSANVAFKISDLPRVSYENFSIQAYPNPVRDVLNLRFSQPDITSVEITDLQGRSVLQEEIHSPLFEMNIPIDQLPIGHYMVSAHTEDGKASHRRFIVIP